MNKKKIKQITEIVFVIIIVLITGYNLYNKLSNKDAKISTTENKKALEKQDKKINNQDKEKSDTNQRNENDTNKEQKQDRESTQNNSLEITRDIFKPIITIKQDSENIKETQEKTKKVYSKLNINGVIKTSKNKNAIVLESGEIINEGEKIRESTLLKIQGDTAYLVTEDWDVIKISIWEENNEK